MEEISDKAKIVYAALDTMGAHGIENKVSIYAIMDFISEEEDVAEHPLCGDILQYEFVNNIMEMELKSTAAVLTGLCKRGYVGKTDPIYTKINGKKKYLRYYFLPKQLTNG